MVTTRKELEEALDILNVGQDDLVLIGTDGLKIKKIEAKDNVCQLIPEVDYENWLLKNEEELWIKYHETGACYDSDYERWCEEQYEIQLSGICKTA